jgi:hypothetical protein
VLRIDPVDGVPVVVSGTGVGTGSLFSSLTGLAVEADGRILVSDTGLGSILRVDPTTGDRAVLSGAMMGAGPLLVEPRGIALDATGALYVADASRHAVVRVDPISGARTIVSDAATGTGPSFGILTDVAFDAAGGLWTLAMDALFRVEEATGDRTIVSDPNTGTGNPPAGWFGLDLDGSGRPLVADWAYGALIAIDPVTGDRSFVSGLGMGSGPELGGPNDLILTPAIDQDGDGLRDIDEVNVLGSDPLSTDTDGDGVPDGQDGCILMADPMQSDFDGDGQGDACDLDDGRLLITAMAPARVEWQAEPLRFDGYNVYRGDLETLRSTGEYSQPVTVPGAASFCGVNGSGLDDPYVPSPGKVVFYLVAGTLDGVEGASPLGENSGGLPRPHSTPCPGP